MQNPHFFGSFFPPKLARLAGPQCLLTSARWRPRHLQVRDRKCRLNSTSLRKRVQVEHWNGSHCGHRPALYIICREPRAAPAGRFHCVLYIVLLPALRFKPLDLGPFKANCRDKPANAAACLGHMAGGPRSWLRIRPAILLADGADDQRDGGKAGPEIRLLTAPRQQQAEWSLIR